jgi:uncharacterized protein
MKFYNREKEVHQLRNIAEQAKLYAQMTFVVGRRRIGKTSLLLEAYKNETCLYFFVAKKNEALLCVEFIEEIKNKLNIPIFGEIKSFKALFGLLLEVSKTQHFTVIIDEFQEFHTVNKTVYSEMQHLWDIQKNESHINLVLCGSVYSLMTQIFQNAKEPLFGRATHRLHVKAFDIHTLKQILLDFHPDFIHEDLLALYMFTGGVAKYVELLMHSGCYTKSDFINYMFTEDSLFIDEGKNLLIEEFGKDYLNYFSILSLIASGKTSRVEIESIMETQTGGFLDRLEQDYGLVRKIRPLFAKPNGRIVKYNIEDNFLNFWFRFIYKYRSAVESGNTDYIKQIIERDYEVYSGKVLEKYFIEHYRQSKKYNLIGTYWDRNSQNEIDIIAVNELEKSAVFVEVKRNPHKIDLSQLQKKSEHLLHHFQGFQIHYEAKSLPDM